MSWNSIQGESAMTGPGASPSGQSRLATIVWVQVVPHFGGVHTKMSRGRGSKSAQRRVVEDGGAIRLERRQVDGHQFSTFSRSPGFQLLSKNALVGP